MMSKQSKPNILLLLVIMPAVLWYSYEYWRNHRISSVNSYETCIKSPGSRLVSFESYEECATTQNKRFPKPTPTPRPIPSPSALISKTTSRPNWLTFQGEYIAISYPEDWLLTGPQAFSAENPAQALYLSSPTGYSGIQIGIDFDFAYGFAGPDNKTHSATRVELGNNTYQATQTIYDNIIFTTIEHPGIPTIIEDKLDLIVMFGNGYPIGIYSDQSNIDTSLAHYYQEEQTINQILSTFRFTDQ